MKFLIFTAIIIIMMLLNSCSSGNYLPNGCPGPADPNSRKSKKHFRDAKAYVPINIKIGDKWYRTYVPMYIPRANI